MNISWTEVKDGKPEEWQPVRVQLSNGREIESCWRLGVWECEIRTKQIKVMRWRVKRIYGLGEYCDAREEKPRRDAICEVELEDGTRCEASWDGRLWRVFTSPVVRWRYRPMLSGGIGGRDAGRGGTPADETG